MPLQAGLSKDQQMLKTVWQWRYQSLFLQKSTQIRHQQRTARHMTCTILCITTRQRMSWGFEKLKERLFMGRIQLTANIFKKKTAKLTKTGLRLNAKYKLERMGRLLDRGKQRRVLWCVSGRVRTRGWGEVRERCRVRWGHSDKGRGFIFVSGSFQA